MDLPKKHNLKLNVYFTENQVRINNNAFQNADDHKFELKVLKEGIVKKKSPWFHYNTRKLTLYNTPKLEYTDQIKNIIKGVICLCKECKAILVDSNIFELITPNRTFLCKVLYF